MNPWLMLEKCREFLGEIYCHVVGARLLTSNCDNNNIIAHDFYSWNRQNNDEITSVEHLKKPLPWQRPETVWPKHELFTWSTVLQTESNSVTVHSVSRKRRSVTQMFREFHHKCLLCKSKAKPSLLPRIKFIENIWSKPFYLSLISDSF